MLKKYAGSPPQGQDKKMVENKFEVPCFKGDSKVTG